MILPISDRSIEAIDGLSLLGQGLSLIRERGLSLSVRGQQTKEILGLSFSILVDKAIYILPERRNNIFATVAECLWVLSGRNDIAWLTHYLPKATDFSDDGTVWRGGYGPRLRNWGRTPVNLYSFFDKDGDGLDQFKAILERLHEDLYTRRAVGVIFDPALDNCQSKDIPCNDWFQFLVRKDTVGLYHLHCMVTIRSSDFVWGLTGVNVSFWALLTRILAPYIEKFAGEKVLTGHLTVLLGSSHYYSQMDNRVQEILDVTNPLCAGRQDDLCRLLVPFPVPQEGLFKGKVLLPGKIPPISQYFLYDSGQLFKLVHWAQGLRELAKFRKHDEPDDRTDSDLSIPELLEMTNEFGTWSIFAKMFLLWEIHKSSENRFLWDTKEDLVRVLIEMPNCDLTWAAIEFLSRSKKKGRQGLWKDPVIQERFPKYREYMNLLYGHRPDCFGRNYSREERQNND